MELVKAEILKLLKMITIVVGILKLVKMMITEAHLFKREKDLLMIQEALKLGDRSMSEIHNNSNIKVQLKDNKGPVNTKDINPLFQLGHQERGIQKMISFRIYSKTNLLLKKMTILLALLWVHKVDQQLVYLAYPA